VRASQIVRTHSVRLVGAAPRGEPGDSPEMDGGIEQNPAYGTALTLSSQVNYRTPHPDNRGLTPQFTPTRLLAGLSERPEEHATLSDSCR
jgi:hypothetical protein